MDLPCTKSVEGYTADADVPGALPRHTNAFYARLNKKKINRRHKDL
jgi:hypothetical protein